MDDHEDLSSLENDADEFDRLLIQNARDERRLKEALNGTRRVTAFSKARAAKHVGLTLDNLQRNNARSGSEPGPNAQVKFDSPPSSSGSARSDPAIHAPPTWGRKSRTNRNWMRSITYEEQVQVQTPPPVQDTVNGLYEDQYEQHEGDNDDANLPRHSVEDSPLSHKGTPRNDRSAEWDLTFELNEASMIASTPYIPRNTALDDIREREIESAKLDRLRQGSPEEARRARASVAAKGANSTQQTMQGSASPEKRRSWQSIGKSQPVTGSGKENLPVAVYKTTTETVSVVEGDVDTGTQKRPVRPLRHRREDSQDLLRRLARASNTPSPGRVAASRPHTAPARQPNSLSQPTQVDTPPDTPDKTPQGTEADRVVVERIRSDQPPAAEELIPENTQDTRPQEVEMPPEAVNPPEGDAEDADATPMPVERSILAPKTPVVTGAWVDTPGPRTARKQLSIARSPASSPEKKSPQKQAPPPVDKALEETTAEAIRPQVPRSALQAVVQEAKAHGQQEPADYGDSTINSLEDLIASPTGEVEEDTLQGLQLPTVTPRNEAERQRQQELLHLHRMNDRLRAARTSIRDASRGMKRVEDRVEHGEEVDGAGRTAVLACPCAAQGHLPLWKYPIKVFWDPRLKTQRSGSRTRMLGGLTALSLLLLGLLIWWISEEVACEFYCHHPYATYSHHQFSVNANAPQYPFVLPTLFYRSFVRAWWEPSSLVTRWMWRNTVGDVGPTPSAASTAAAWATGRSVVEEAVWEQSMLQDEVLR